MILLMVTPVAAIAGAGTLVTAISPTRMDAVPKVGDAWRLLGGARRTAINRAPIEETAP